MGSGDDELLHFNGINVATGGYGLAPMSSERLAALIANKPLPENDDELRARTNADKLEKEGHLGVKEGVDAKDLAQAGWGVVFAFGEDPAVREALQPLLRLRRAQATRLDPRRYREFWGGQGYRTPKREKKKDFLTRHDAAPSGPVDPDRMPYYMLLVGSPEQIPYSFQYQLDVQYGVGRLWFPTVEQYAHYAASVVEAEVHGIRRPRRMSFFGVRNPDDRATDLSARLLIEPLASHFATASEGWELRTLMGEEATHAGLETLLGGEQTPALLFTASHGVEFPMGDPRQVPHQGALLCGDWPGPRQWKERIPEHFYFAGEHLAADADVSGMMLFCFACYGAGIPQYDEFSKLGKQELRQIAPHPFVSALPMAMLGRPGGALAVVGHVDRAWGCSFSGGGGSQTKSYTNTFESTIGTLLGEQPVGLALDYFNARYAEASTELTDELQDEFVVDHDPFRLSALWTENNDARGYVVFGDPAARLTFTGGAPDEAAVEELLASLGSGGEDQAQHEAPDAHFGVVEPEPEAVIARPPEISEADWERTPEAVRAYIDRLRSP